MRYLIFLLLLFTPLFTMQLTAQTWLGLRGGANFATVSTTKDGQINGDLVAGKNFALYFDFGTGQNSSVQAEVNYLEKGYIREWQFFDPQRHRYKLSYLDFPVLFKYRIVTDRNKPDVYLLAGPYFGFGLSGRRKDLNHGDTYDLKFDGSDIYHVFDTGLLFGGGIELPVARKRSFIVDLRYGLGLFKINESNLADGWLRNRGIILSVGYAWQIAR